MPDPTQPGPGERLCCGKGSGRGEDAGEAERKEASGSSVKFDHALFSEMLREMAGECGDVVWTWFFELL